MTGKTKKKTDGGVSQPSKADKHLCQINTDDDLLAAIKRRKNGTGLFREVLFKDALKQLLQPYTVNGKIYQMGMGHPDFKFLAPPRKSADTSTLSIWIPNITWKRVKEVVVESRVNQNAVIYTALYNFFILP